MIGWADFAGWNHKDKAGGRGETGVNIYTLNNGAEKKNLKLPR